MVVAGLEDLCALISEHREEAEDRARLAPSVVAACGEAGLWVAAAPREVGGLELSLPDFLALSEQLAEADPAVAWHLINSGGAGHAAAFVPDSVRQEVFASLSKPFGFSGAVAAGIKVAQSNGGYELNGTWPFMTGVLDADWACVTVMIDAENGQADGPPDVRRILMPLEACETHLTWDYASSMRGTGSHAVTARSVVVPGEATIGFRASPLLDRAGYRTPSQLPFVGGAAATAVGVLRSTIAGVVDLCEGKVSRFDGRKHFEDPRVQHYIADAIATADSLSANLQTRAAVLWKSYEAGEKPLTTDRARWWAAVFHAADSAADQVSQLYRIATSAAYGSRNRVERGLKDIHTIPAAFESFQTLRRDAGGVLLGQQSKHPLL